MKKVLKFCLIFVIIIVVLFGGLYLYASTMMQRDAKHGAKENQIAATTSDINQKLNIVYMGDSLTAGWNSVGNMVPDNKGYRGLVDDQLKTDDKLGTSYNYAVGGYLIDDVLKQMRNDDDVNKVNQEMRDTNDKFTGELLDEYPTDLEDSPKLSEAIKQANTLVITIGANDVLENVTFKDGSIDVDVQGLLDTMTEVHEKKEQLFKDIHKINPDIKIIDVGIYFAYAHIDESLMNTFYPLLAYGESKIFFDQPKDNVYRVRLRDNMQANLKEFVDNPNDVHPNITGYKIMANEVLKVIDEAYKGE